MLDTIFAKLPAKLYELAVAIRGEVDQTLERALELDAHSVQIRDRLEQLDLGAADRVTGLLLTFMVLRAGSGSLRFVLGDPGLVLELGQERRELGDLGDDPAHARQFVVCLLHRVCTQPLHGSTIAARRPITFGRRERQTSVMDTVEIRRRIAAARVARLATTGADLRPHIVPICFALDEQTLYFAVDAKPKRTTNLKRLRNIAVNPAVSILIDHYEEDWEKLWWVRLDGSARALTEGADVERALHLLDQRYIQYRAARPGGPVVAVAIEGMTGWSAS